MSFFLAIFRCRGQMLASVTTSVTEFSGQHFGKECLHTDPLLPAQSFNTYTSTCLGLLPYANHGKADETGTTNTSSNVTTAIQYA